MTKDILYEQEARKQIWTGIRTVADTVKSTLGPRGREVLIVQESGTPVVVKKGYEIVHATALQDPHARMGVDLMKEVSQKMKDLAGDGTTTAMVLAAAILEEGMKNLAAGANPIELRRGIQGAAQLASAAIRKLSVPVNTLEDIRKIASISAGNDLAGELLAEAMDRVGVDGIISVEETPNTETLLDITEGMQYEKGYLNQEMLKDPASQGEMLEHPYILVTDQEINNLQEILPLLEEVHVSGRPFLIIAEKISPAVLSMLIMNKKQGIFNAIAVHPPAYGEGRRDRMKDICIFTGGAYISPELGTSIGEASIDMLGTAEMVDVSKYSTSIINGGGDPEEIRRHIASLRHMISAESYDFKQEKLKERLAKFSGGVAVIKVGGVTEAEMKELKYQLDDAVQSVKAAMEEGMAPGGGTTYLDMLPAIRAYVNSLTGDRKVGAEIIFKALQAPTMHIAANAGKEAPVVVNQVMEAGRGFGYDVVTGRICPMMEAGVIDAGKVLRLALQCAASVASTILTAEASVTIIQEEQEEEAV